MLNLNLNFIILPPPSPTELLSKFDSWYLFHDALVERQYDGSRCTQQHGIPHLRKGNCGCILKVPIHRVGYEKKFWWNFPIFKSQCFFKVLTGTQLYAQIHFDRKCFVFMKLWYKNNNMRRASPTL